MTSISYIATLNNRRAVANVTGLPITRITSGELRCAGGADDIAQARYTQNIYVNRTDKDRESYRVTCVFDPYRNVEDSVSVESVEVMGYDEMGYETFYPIYEVVA